MLAQEMATVYKPTNPHLLNLGQKCGYNAMQASPSHAEAGGPCGQ